jgi:hypothetical protein
MRWRPRWAVLVAASLLGLAGGLVGCASGGDMTRPDRRLFPLGSATFADVVARFGTPQASSESVRDGVRIRTIWYSYSDAHAEPAREGVVPVRLLEYDFSADRLVGQIFASSFKSDSTEFDPNLARVILTGVATSDEVVTLIGRPSALFLAPMVKAPATTGVGYFEEPMLEGAGWSFRSSLTVSFDDNDHAVGVELRAPAGQ